jgi:hypothetical protein
LAAPIMIALQLTVAASVGAQSHNPKAPAALTISTFTPDRDTST